MTDKTKKESMDIPLSLSKNYVAHWGIKEAVREILQNALDCKDHKITHYDNAVLIVTNNGVIPRNAFLLGESGKTEGDTIGHYGEGLKLALLILTRENIPIIIRNGFETWTPYFKYSELYQTEALHIKIEEDLSGNEDEVSILIEGITDEEADFIEMQYLSEEIKNKAIVNYSDCQIFDPDELFDPSYLEDQLYEDEEYVTPRRIYCGGLYVCDLPNGFKYSYNFTPDKIKLDRDRMTVRTWDVQWEISALLVKSGNEELLVNLAQEGAEDIKGYTEHHVGYYSTGSSKGSELTFNERLLRHAVNNFKVDHGEKAIPIDATTDFKKRNILVNRIKAAGYTPVEVNHQLFSMLGDGIEIPDDLDLNVSTDLKKLFNDWYSSVEDNLSEDNKKEFNNLVDLIGVV